MHRIAGARPGEGKEEEQQQTEKEESRQCRRRGGKKRSAARQSPQNCKEIRLLCQSVEDTALERIIEKFEDIFDSNLKPETSAIQAALLFCASVAS